MSTSSKIASAAGAALFALTAGGRAVAGDAGGFYVGALAGAGAEQSDRTETKLPTLFMPYSQTATSPGDDFTPSLSLLVGKEWRVSDRFSLGLEAEGAYEDARGAWSGGAKSFFYGGPFGGGASDNVTSSSVWSLDWQTALRARVAYALTPAISVFAAAGPALGYARLHSSLVEQNFGEYFNRGTLSEVSYNNTYTGAYDRTAWRPGLSVDVGLEAAVGNGVSFRAGYGVTAFQPISLTVGLPSLPASSLLNAPTYAGDLKATPLLQSARFGFIKRF